jgi:hypothetical protein
MKARQTVYDTYWKTAAERQEIFFRRLEGAHPPYTADPIFQEFKCCNVYRASDRVSQFLIQNVIYKGKFNEEDTLFRIFLFRLLNKSETWTVLEQKLGEMSLRNFTFDRYSKALEELKSTSPIYGNAFILCATKAFGYDQKHKNHLALLESVFQKTNVSSKLIQSKSLKQLFENLKKLPLIGNFMAYQIAIDFNYSEAFCFNENHFTCAGPGAIRGIKKCFLDTEGKSNEYIIQYMVENQEEEFKRLDINFKNLWGRPMHAIDCQGWFCETDKYCRVKFPELKSNRKKFKSTFTPSITKIEYFYPPKWGINTNIPT